MISRLMKLSKTRNSRALPSITTLQAEKKNYVLNWYIAAHSARHQLQIHSKPYWKQPYAFLRVPVSQQLPWKTSPPKPVSHAERSYGTFIVRMSCSHP